MGGWWVVVVVGVGAIVVVANNSSSSSGISSSGSSSNRNVRVGVVSTRCCVSTEFWQFLLCVRLCTAGLMLVWVWFQHDVVCKRNYAIFLLVVRLCTAGLMLM